jgi:flagellar basal body-associated protein FliL
MAEEELRNKQQQANTAPDEQGESEKATKPADKKKPKMMFLVGGVLLLVVIAAGGYLFFARSSSAATDGTEKIAQGDKKSEPGSTEKPEAPPKKSHRSGGEGDTSGTNIFFTEFPTSIINLGPSEVSNYVYLKYGFNLELDSEEVKVELSNKLPKISSIVDTLLTGRKWDQIGNQRGRHALEKEITLAINDELETGRVIGCYFTTFVAQ